GAGILPKKNKKERSLHLFHGGFYPGQDPFGARDGGPGGLPDGGGEKTERDRGKDPDRERRPGSLLFGRIRKKESIEGQRNGFHEHVGFFPKDLRPARHPIERIPERKGAGP